jgi:HD-like signal output (HDOD) protein
MPKQYEDVLAVAAVSGAPLLVCEREILGTDHAELSALAISRWELADSIRWAAFYHHEPEKAVTEHTKSGTLRFSLAVHEADALINSLGMSVRSAPRTPRLAAPLEFPGFAFSKERVLKRMELELKGLALD